MSAVIKRDRQDISGVRAMSVLEAKAPVDPVIDPVARRIAQLESELRRRDKTISDLRAEVAAAFDRGLAEGRDNGLSEAQDREDTRLALLAGAIGEARTELQAKFEAIEHLAALLARECVDKMLGNVSRRADLVCELIEAQLSRIEKASLLRVTVSAADFSDQGALDLLAAKIGCGRASIAADDSRPSGSCTLGLKLGEIDVGLDQQWHALSALLDDLAERGVPA